MKHKYEVDNTFKCATLAGPGCSSNNLDASLLLADQTAIKCVSLQSEKGIKISR
jgi:hypothetical protein